MDFLAVTPLSKWTVIIEESYRGTRTVCGSVDCSVSLSTLLSGIDDDCASAGLESQTRFKNQGKQHRSENERKDCRHDKAAQDNAPETSIQFTASAGVNDQGKHSQHCCRSTHEDRPNASADTVSHCLPMIHAVLANVHQSLVYDQNRVVNNSSDENDKAEHRQRVELLHREQIQKCEASKTADSRHGDADHNDQRIKKRLVECGNQ